jgi:hypothetical protein
MLVAPRPAFQLWIHWSAWAAEHYAIDGGQAVASLLGAVRAVGQDDACRRLPARDPIGQGPAVSKGTLSPLPG